MFRLQIFAWIACITAASAADTVELASGDRISGSVVKIEGGNLYFLTKFSSTALQIDWREVGHLSLEEERKVLLEDGEQVMANEFGSAASGLQLSLVSSVPAKAAVEEEEKGWFGRARENSSLSADFGQSYSGLSKYNQLSSNAEVEYEGGRWDGSFVMHFNYYGGTEDSRPTYQAYGRLIAQRYLRGDRFFVFPYLFMGRQTQADGAAGQLRQYGGGVGWTFRRHKPDQISVLSGVVRSLGTGYTKDAEDGRRDLRTADWLAISGVSWDKTLRNKVELSLRLYAFKPVTLAGHMAMATDASAKIPLYGPAYFTVRAYDTPELRQHQLLSVKNLQLSSGIGIEF